MARNTGLLEADVDGEVVALNVDTGNCYGLNRVGSRVWQLLAAPVAIDDICAKLLTEYAVDHGTCERQVLELLEELRAEGIVITHGDG